jgi:hypothetical protein
MRLCARFAEDQRPPEERRLKEADDDAEDEMWDEQLIDKATRVRIETLLPRLQVRRCWHLLSLHARITLSSSPSKHL